VVVRGGGRLKPGVTIEQGGSSMSIFATQLEKEYPTENAGRNVRLMPLLEFRRDPTGNGQLTLLSAALMAVVFVVLLIACANIANLLMARATRRKREIAVRLAIGASRFRLVKQLMTESILLAALGGAVGILVAFEGVKLLVSLDVFGNGPAPNAQQPTLDLGVLVFTAGVCLLSGFLFGLAPSLQATRSDLVGTLKGDITMPAASRGLRLIL